MSRFGKTAGGNRRRHPLRQDDWQDPKTYVARRLVVEARNYDKNSDSMKTVADRFRWAADAWISSGYSDDELQTHLCNYCGEEKPFYDYYSKSEIRCKECQPKRQSVPINTPERIRKRIATAYVITIKHELGKGNNKDISNPIPIVWDEIEKHLGYNKEDLLRHLESRFEPWMDWSCWGRTRKNQDGKCWEIDHIKPRSTYEYTGINTPEFKEIWSLGNIRPLSRKENTAKGA